MLRLSPALQVPVLGLSSLMVWEVAKSSHKNQASTKSGLLQAPLGNRSIIFCSFDGEASLVSRSLKPYQTIEVSAQTAPNRPKPPQTIERSSSPSFRNIYGHGPKAKFRSPRERSIQSPLKQALKWVVHRKPHNETAALSQRTAPSPGPIFRFSDVVQVRDRLP